ncbi:MAG: hypothetical protein V3U65_01765 [Granulosicoccaceae bacterium]
MATAHKIIGEEWRARAPELADWAMDTLVNRKDVWGQYSVLTPTERKTSERSYKAMTLPAKTQRGGNKVTLDKLTRHFASRHSRKPQIIGLHAKSETITSRWFGIDVDCHDTEAIDAEDLGRRNLNACVNWYQKLQGMGLDPLLFDSNGAGGYHLWVLFSAPAPTATVFAFVQDLINDWEEQHLEKRPETFPKAVKEGSIGSWFRLPGLHHTHEHYSTVWAGDEGLDDPWLKGHAAVEAMLSCVPSPFPAGVSKAKRKAVKQTVRKTEPKDAEPGDPVQLESKRSFKRSARAKVCVDLDGVLASRTSGASIGPPVDGAIEFTRALAQHSDIIIYTARFSTATGTARTQNAIDALSKRIGNWLDKHGIEYHSIHSAGSKPIASAYVDDRAVSCTPIDNGVAAFDAALIAVDNLCNQDS